MAEQGVLSDYDAQTVVQLITTGTAVRPPDAASTATTNTATTSTTTTSTATTSTGKG